MVSIVIIFIIILIMVLYIINLNNITKQKEKIIKQNEKRKIQQKIEYCDYYINQLENTDSLIALFYIHKLIWVHGLRNNNIGPDEYGMFRTNNIITMTPQEVYLGNIYGLNTYSLAKWNDYSYEEYDMIFNQYKRHLILNLKSIKSDLTNKL